MTRFPLWLRRYYTEIVWAMDGAAKLLPRLRLPLGFYLDERRIFGEEWTHEQYHADPLSLTSYPLHFLASLFSADMSFLGSGRIKCPVVVIASTGDPLFPFDYVERVYEGITAPRKEMLVFDLDRHLIFNECLDEVLPRLSEELARHAGQGR